MQNIIRRTASAVLLALFLTSPSLALGKPEPQVQVEARIMYVTNKARDFGIEWAIVATPKEGGKTQYEVSTVAKGQGADFRKWIPQSTELIPVGGGKPELPAIETKIYIEKTGKLQMLAVPLFAALGSQYVGRAGDAASHPGTPCSAGSDEGEHKGIHEGVDRVGMAAGMGLLASQAKGQMEGRKYTFLSDIPLSNALFRTRVQNKDKHELIVIVTPKVITTEDSP